MSNSGLLKCTGYSPNLMTKSKNKGQIVWEKYSGIIFFQTPGRTSAFRFGETKGNMARQAWGHCKLKKKSIDK